MSTKTKTSPVMKIVAIVLILASAAMLFLPWMKVGVTYNGVSLSGGEILRRAAAENGMSEEYFRLELREEINDLSSRAQRRYGVYLDADTLYDTAMLAIRLSWSPFALSKMLGNVKSLTPQFTQYVEMESGYATSTFMQATSGLGLARMVLLILLILTLAMAAVAVVCILTDHRLGALPYAIFAVILLVLFIVVIIVGNNYMGEILDLLDYSRMEGAISFQIGFGGILCGVLAILGFVALFLPIGNREPVYAGTAPRAWKCPHCGAARKASEKFCLNCGAKRPEEAPVRAAAPAGWKCPSCGTMLRADQRFCLYCGTKRPETPTPAPAPAPAAPAKRPAAPTVWVCPGCGAKLKTSQKFCSRCGGKQPEAPAPAAPVMRPAAPTVWTCPGCGAKLKTSQKFCPRCGGKQPEAPAPAAPVMRPAAPAGWICPNCGEKLSDAQKFCYACGAKKPDAPAPKPKPAPVPKPRICPSCGAALQEKMAFCPVCGTRAQQPEESYKPTPAAPAPVISEEPEERTITSFHLSHEEPEEGTISPFRAAPVTPETPAPAPAAPENGFFQIPSDDDL